MKIVIINGPNLGRLGRRKPQVYGTASNNDMLGRLQFALPDVEFIYHQSNSEGEIIDLIEEYGYREDIDGVVINPGAFTHYSYAIADAIEAADTPFVEVHISNIFGREEFRSHSVTGPHCRAVIAGMGVAGYEMAARYLTSPAEK